MTTEGNAMERFTLYPLYALTTSDPRNGGERVDTIHYEGSPEGLTDMRRAMQAARLNGLETSIREVGTRN